MKYMNIPEQGMCGKIATIFEIQEKGCRVVRLEANRYIGLGGGGRVRYVCVAKLPRQTFKVLPQKVHFPDCPTFITPTFITSDIHHLRHSSPPT